MLPGGGPIRFVVTIRNLEPESLLDASGRPVDTGHRGREDAEGAVPAAPDPAGSPRTCEVDECIRNEVPAYPATG